MAEPADMEGSLRTLYLGLLQKSILNLIYPESEPDQGVHVRQGTVWPKYAHSMIGNARLSRIWSSVETVLHEAIPGDLVETGVWRGGACIFMRGILKAHGILDRKVWVVDSFKGLPSATPIDGYDLSAHPELAISKDKVKEYFSRYDLLDDLVQFVEGWFADTLPTMPVESISVLRLDGDYYTSTMTVLDTLYPKVAKGGFILVDDYGAIESCRKAVHDYRDKHGINTPLTPTDHTEMWWRKE